jgi:hypothetical protein
MQGEGLYQYGAVGMGLCGGYSLPIQSAHLLPYIALYGSPSRRFGGAGFGDFLKKGFDVAKSALSSDTGQAIVGNLAGSLTSAATNAISDLAQGKSLKQTAQRAVRSVAPTVREQAHAATKAGIDVGRRQAEKAAAYLPGPAQQLASAAIDRAAQRAERESARALRQPRAKAPRGRVPQEEEELPTVTLPSAPVPAAPLLTGGRHNRRVRGGFSSYDDYGSPGPLNAGQLQLLRDNKHKGSSEQPIFDRHELRMFSNVIEGKQILQGRGMKRY